MFSVETLSFTIKQNPQAFLHIVNGDFNCPINICFFFFFYQYIMISGINSSYGAQLSLTTLPNLLTELYFKGLILCSKCV